MEKVFNSDHLSALETYVHLLATSPPYVETRYAAIEMHNSIRRQDSVH
jgi:hypothetical protein